MAGPFTAEALILVTSMVAFYLAFPSAVDRRNGLWLRRWAITVSAMSAAMMLLNLYLWLRMNGP